MLRHVREEKLGDLLFCRLFSVDNDTKSRVFCGPMSIAAITGQPVSLVKDALRTARWGDKWPERGRTPPVMGVDDWELKRALRLLGVHGYWKEISNSPTLAAFLDKRNQLERDSPMVVNVTSHFIAVAGGVIVDTFSRGEPVDIDKAPRRRKRVQRIFIITSKGGPISVTRKPTPKRRRESDAARNRFRRLCKKAGATYFEDQDTWTIGVEFQDGRSLELDYEQDAWEEPLGYLEKFLSLANPAEGPFFKCFDDDDDGECLEWRTWCY